MSARQFAESYVTPKGVKCKLIGRWGDMVAYYAGDDGNAYSFNACIPGARVVCDGNLEEFRARFGRMYRGELFA